MPKVAKQDEQGAVTNPVLKWWKENRSMPCLRRYAAAVMSLQTSAAQIERDFSTLGTIMTPQRSRLDSRMLDAVAVCRLNLNEMPQSEFEVPAKLQKPRGQRNLRTYLPPLLDRQSLQHLQEAVPNITPARTTESIVNDKVNRMPVDEARLFLFALLNRFLSGCPPELLKEAAQQMSPPAPEEPARKRTRKGGRR